MESGWNVWVWLVGVVSSEIYHRVSRLYKIIHTFHPLSTIVIHTFNLCKVQSMDDNCGEWVECMGVASGSGWNLWVWLLGVVVRRYIDFLILLIPTPLVSGVVCACSCIKQYVQPSCGCRGTPVVAGMCVYTARKNY